MRTSAFPGVGPIVALGFIATVDDAGRFTKATDVGAYLHYHLVQFQTGFTANQTWFEIYSNSLLL